jgi:hypothetical protein
MLYTTLVLNKEEGMFDIDLKGYAKLLGDRSKGRILVELIQNAWDEDSSKVEVELKKLQGKPLVEITVTDDNPEGFKDLTHAYTLFAESAKKSDPTKRGRFNKGEKDVIVVCKEASISTTKGGVYFDVASGVRKNLRKKRESGSVFKGTLRMNADEYKETLDLFNSLINPEGVKTYINGKLLENKIPLKVFESKLPTVYADSEGILKPTIRKTDIEIFEVTDGDTPMLFEMGIPVVELGDDKWHVNIKQKVPLNSDRDNVTPSFLKKVRVTVLNHAYDNLEEDDCSDRWVRDASAHGEVEKEALTKVIDSMFGKKRVVFSPNDPESNNKAVSEGYTVISGKQMSKDEWANVKSHINIPSASETFGKKGFVSSDLITSPSDDMEKVIRYTELLGEHLLGFKPEVTLVRAPDATVIAQWGDGCFTYNVSLLGEDWFSTVNEKTDALIIHEFGHHYCSNHLSRKYYDALCELGAKLKKLALEKPELFDDFK